MKSFLSLILLLAISQSAFAATLQTNNVTSLGGVANTSDLTIPEGNSQGYFSLYGGGNALSQDRYTGFYKNGSAYQVTTGKTFQVSKICSTSSSTNVFWQLVSSTVAIAFNTGTALTSGVYQSGAATQYLIRSTSVALQYQCFDTTYAFTSLVYPGFQVNSAIDINVILTGKEI